MHPVSINQTSQVSNLTPKNIEHLEVITDRLPPPSATYSYIYDLRHYKIVQHNLGSLCKVSSETNSLQM